MKDFLDTVMSFSSSNKAGNVLITNTTSISYLLVLNGARNRWCVVVMWLQMQMVSGRVHAACRQHLAVHPHTQYCGKPRGTQRKLNIQDHRPAAATGRGGGTLLPLQFCSKGTRIPLLVYLSRSLSYITPTLFYYKTGGNLILTHPPIHCPPVPLPTRCIILRLFPPHHFFLSIPLCGPVPCQW